jgi:hypothetical protein
LVIFGLVDIGFGLFGVLAGILAIALAKPGQRSTVIPRAVIGLFLLSFLVAIAVPNFVRARAVALQNKQAVAELHTAVRDFRAQAVASLTNGEGGAVDSQRLQRSLSRAAEISSGETAALLKGSQLFVTRLQGYQHAYEQAARELVAAKVLTARTIQQRAQIQERKVLVQKFLDANDAFKTFLLQSESNYRKELAAFEISPAQTEAAMAGFRKNSGLQSPFMVDIRQADDRMGHAMLEVLNLYDSQWGQWRYDAGAGLVRFQDRTAVGEYNAFMAEIKQASADQAVAQKRLAAAISQSGSPL